MPAIGVLRVRYAASCLWALSGGFFAAQWTQHDFGFAFELTFCGFSQLQCLILGDVDGEVAEADALADDAAPFFVGLPAADAEGGEFVEAVAPYPVVALYRAAG